MSQTYDPEWFLKQAEVTALARALVCTIDEWTPSDVISYLEKPWKWTPEYGRWVAAGRPESVPDEDESVDR